LHLTSDGGVINLLNGVAARSFIVELCLDGERASV
jgi:hypothetical protein